MSDSGASLYDEVFEGLKCNRELEIYYNDSTYGVVLIGRYGNSGKMRIF